jgi:PleD family two-component response regulator
VQRTVIAALDDIFFTAKIRGTAEHAGARVRFCRDAQATIEAVRETNAALVIVDLHARQFDPFALARALKEDARLSTVKLLGFFSHVQTALMQQAKEAGFDYVLPRSVFSNRLAEILEGRFQGQGTSAGG